jgi:hypothetical protein
MPARVPIRNGKFSNAPDFNNQGVTGITGSGVFRSFNYLNTGSSSRTLQNSDLWSVIEVTGNCVIAIPDTLDASVGDEIIIVNPAGLTSFITNGAAVTLMGTADIVLTERPARLIYLGAVAGYTSQTWLLSGLKTSLTSTTPTDCCTNTLSSFYTLGAFSVDSVVYANASATSLYTSSNVGNVVVVGGTGYTITSGAVTESPCASAAFDYGYTFYVSDPPQAFTLYTYIPDLTITANDQIAGVPFKTSNPASIYLCDTTGAAQGTYYRAQDGYGVISPVCFVNGIVTSFSPCT